jgi:large subunit ribosomal protein L9
MEIILKQDFKGLGYKNELVKVKPGYARNYLIPQGIALVANEANKKVALENARQMAHKIAKRKQDAEAIAARLSQLTIQLKVKAGETGRLFGAVTPIQVAEALQEQTGYVADRRDIGFEKAVKTLGVHKAIVKLHKEVAVTLQLKVVAEE